MLVLWTGLLGTGCAGVGGAASTDFDDLPPAGRLVEESAYAIRDRNLQCVVRLERGELIFADAAIDFLDELGGQFSGNWRFEPAQSVLSEAAIAVLSSAAALSPQGAPGVELVLGYTPAAADPPTGKVHWVQVVETNHRTDSPHGRVQRFVDVPRGALTPYYDDYYRATGELFYDFPVRDDRMRDHHWQATTFLVVGPGWPGRVTVLLPGVRWGWSNTCW